MTTGDHPACTCPAQAREVIDRIEAAIAAEHADRLAGELPGDWAPEVPGSSEPPD
ncbi:MAG TPA: hypothetical protein VD864_15300 [Nocardioides sp.]|nr:hypothetical protein [Nocardioides sp.]